MDMGGRDERQAKAAVVGGGRRRQTRRAAVLSAAGGAAAVGLLGACAPGEAPAGGAQGGRPALSGQKVTFLHWWTDAIIGPGMSQGMEWTAAQFKERTGVDVDYVDGRAGGGLNEKFLAMSGAGTPPDVSFMSVVIGRDDYDAGLLRNLSPYIAKTPDLGDKEFFDSSKKFRAKGNETFGIPTMGPESLGFMVNSALLGAVGLDPQGKDLRTWDDFTRAAQKLTKGGGDAFQQIGLLAGNLSLAWLSAWLYSNNASLTNPEETKYLLDSPATREVVQYCADMIVKHRVSPTFESAARPANARQALIAGQAAIIYDSSSIGLLNAPPDFKFWFIPVPKGPRGTGVASSTWTNFVSMAKDARAPDAAVEWMRWFTSVESHIGRMRFRSVKGANPRVKLYETAEWKQWVQENPVLGFIPEAAKLPGPYPYLRYNRIEADVAPIMRNMLQGATGVNEGLADAQKKADQIMSEPVRVQ
jgi:multiple sugar transport system substrate-binding protein